MSSTASTQQPSTPERSDKKVHELERSFDAFSRLSRSLERAYDKLRTQAERVDLALAETNRRLAEKVGELDATTGHLQAVLGSLHAAVVVTDPDGRITLTNRAFEELCALDTSALKGRLKAELLDGAGAVVCEPQAGEAATPAVALPCRPLQVAGELRIVRSSRSPVVNGEGKALGEVEVLVDETEVDGLRTALRRRETLTALGEMAAGIAHELRNPLNAVEGFAHLLQHVLPEGTTAPAKQARLHAQRIVAGVRKANSIITNLLCFARPDRFRPRRARLAPLLLELEHAFLDGAETAAPAAGVPASVARARVEVHRPEPPTLEVACDLALLERVLVNLIENARVAAPHGTVSVGAKEADGEVLLTVEDDGPGIPAGMRDRLFHPFVSSRAGGTGLGLFLVHRIVELHRGRVEVAARPGGGTIFTVRLPCPKSRHAARAIPALAANEEGA